MSDIAPQIQADIERHLLKLERQYDIRILYACESGSRAWGFASPDSDYDVRFIYVHRLDWYLTVSPNRDVIEVPISDDLDINGWELRKALGLLLKGNATLIEWMNSPIVYQQDESFISRLRSVAEQVYQPEKSFYHYLHMAKGNYREYLKGERVRLKKYLYVLRPLLAAQWVANCATMAPMRFIDLVDSLISNTDERAAIDDLLKIKRSVSESEYGPSIPTLNTIIKRLFSTLDHVELPTKQPDAQLLDLLLMESVMHNHSSLRS